MFKKLLLFSALCIVNTTIESTPSLARKCAYTGTKILTATAGSFILYKLLQIAINKLQSEGKISQKMAHTLHIYLKGKALVLPLGSLIGTVLNPVSITSSDDLFRIFKHTFQESTSLLGAEYAVLNFLRSLV